MNNGVVGRILKYTGLSESAIGTNIILIFGIYILFVPCVTSY